MEVFFSFWKKLFQHSGGSFSNCLWKLSQLLGESFSKNWVEASFSSFFEEAFLASERTLLLLLRGSFSSCWLLGGSFSSLWIEAFPIPGWKVFQLLCGSFPDYDWKFFQCMCGSFSSFYVKAFPTSGKSFSSFWVEAFATFRWKLFQQLGRSLKILQLLSGSFFSLCVEAFLASVWKLFHLLDGCFSSN